MWPMLSGCVLGRGTQGAMRRRRTTIRAATGRRRTRPFLERGRLLHRGRRLLATARVGPTRRAVRPALGVGTLALLVVAGQAGVSLRFDAAKPGADVLTYVVQPGDSLSV